MGRTVVDIQFPYVYEDVDRHGNVRLYFWRGKGHPKVRIREPLGSAAFSERYAELTAAAAQARAPDPNGRPTVGTWRWLCEEYYKSSRFLGLDATTQ